MVNRIDLTSQPRPQDQRHRCRRRATGGDSTQLALLDSPSRTSTCCATRSTPRSSPRSAPAATGPTGPSRSPTSPPARPPGSTRSSTTRHRTSREEFDDFLDGLRGNLNDGISRDRRDRHAGPAPDHPAGLRRALRGLRSSSTTTRSPRRWSGCSPPSTSTTSTTRTAPSRSSTTRSGCASQGIDTAEGRQRIITELYDTFFATAFKKTVDKLGIVYTPVEIVDFILQLRRRRAAPGVRPGPHRRGRAHPRRLHRHRHLHGPAAPVGPDQARGPRPQVRRTSCTPTRSCCSPTTSPRSTSRPPTTT